MTEKVDTSWNSSILSNKSWVELIEEEEQEEYNRTKSDSFVSFKGLFPANSSVLSSESGIGVSDNSSSPVSSSATKRRRSNRIRDSDKQDQNDYTSTWSRRQDNSDIELFSHRTAASSDLITDPWSRRNNKFEIINEESTNSTKTENEDSKDGLCDSLAIKNNTRRAGMLLRSNNNSRGSFDNNSRESRSNGIAEDLSLTGHLDVFHVNSPAKPLTSVPDGVLDIMCEDAMFSPIKTSDATLDGKAKKRNSEFPEMPSKRKRVNKLEVSDAGSVSSESYKRKSVSSQTFRSERTDNNKKIFGSSSLTRAEGSDDVKETTVSPQPFSDFRKPEYTSPRKFFKSPANGNGSLSSASATSDFGKSEHRSSGRFFESPVVTTGSINASPPASRTRSRLRTVSDCSSTRGYTTSGSYKSSMESLSTNKSDAERYETDPEILSRRQKQIEYGKNTIGYDNYLKSIPKDKRVAADPKTPPKNLRYSRRAWDGLIKSWRLRLHQYDKTNESEHKEMIQKRHSY